MHWAHPAGQKTQLPWIMVVPDWQIEHSKLPLVICSQAAQLDPHPAAVEMAEQVPFW